MAKESTESSVATSPSTPPNNWWDLHNHHRHHHANSLSSWTNNSSCSPWHQNPNSNNSSCEEEVSISTSFTYASNQSGLTAESSHRLFEPPAATAAAASSNELMGEHAPDSHQLWSHVFLSDGSNGELHNTNQDVGENLFNPLSSKTIFDPAYDYLKKMDTNWEFTNPPSSNYNNFEKHFNGITTSDQSCLSSETERLNKLSNLVSHWSIAPPADPEITISRHFNNINPQTCDISLSSSMADHQYNSNSSGTNNVRNSGLFSYYGQDLKTENDEQHDFDGPAMASIFRKPLINSNGIGYNVGFNSNTCSLVEADNKYYYGMPSHTQFSSARNFADAITLSSRLTKPLIDIHVPKPYIKSLNQSECKKQGLKNSSLMQTRMNGKERGGSNEGKKKRHDDTSEAVAKKPKTESSTVSSAKAPKVKLADKITALQQIVSPFGKTDTASVLYEAIGYIKFLQEQVELLSNPYMKTNTHKFQDPWGNLEGKVHKGDVKVDLSSRGLCLVPISCTPKVYHENTGSDYWTPAYRGSLYR